MAPRGVPLAQPLPDVRETSVRMLRAAEGVWRRVFARAGTRYVPARFGGFLEDEAARPCADRDEDLTGLYCPEQRAVYLRRREYAALGPEVWAYVVAHEVGHHVQELRGILAVTDDRLADAPELGRRVEMQADCYAGVWAWATRSAAQDAMAAAAYPNTRWFRTGRRTGRPAACDPYRSPQP